MPTTRPGTFRVAGIQVAISVDRLVAERIKSTLGLGRAFGRPPLHPHHGDEPVLNGTLLEDIEWYHTIELGDGVVTPGFVDHRGQVELYGIPESLAGLRCLDVATFDGFWAFEMEKRGAGEVVAIDLHSRNDCDYPENWQAEYLKARPATVMGLGFAYAKRARRSRVRRRVLSVYELSPERIGLFDFVFVGDLLLHLRDPFLALERVWSVVKPGGTTIIAEPYDAELDKTGQAATRFLPSLDEYSGCLWWLPTTSALKKMIEAARFDRVEEVNRLILEGGMGVDLAKVVFRAHKASSAD